MNRRKFLNKTSKLALATMVPTILPSGLLFAKTEEPKIKHVVLCMYAGGIRNWESIDFKEGNLMPNTFVGDQKINPNIIDGITSLNPILNNPLQTHGTLLKGFRYNSNVTLHYHAHASIISGQYSNTVELMKPLKQPTIFEFFRKHSSAGQDALNAWWVSDQSGPFPFLNGSNHPLYGSNYIANMIQPSTLFDFKFNKTLSDVQKNHLKEILGILDSNQANLNQDKVTLNLNSKVGQEQLKQFIDSTYQNHFKNSVNLWDNLDQQIINDDLKTIFTACEIIDTFQPNLLVVNMQDSDIGHSNFTKYCSNMHIADYALAQLWNKIQANDKMKDNTALIILPEFGRNYKPNSIIDDYGRFAVDHTGDQVSQEIFCLLLGPENVIQQNKVVNDLYGQTTDILPTIAHLLGFNKLIPNQFTHGKVLHEALV